MKVTFCDACGDACKNGASSFNPKVHIVDYIDGRTAGYVDRDGVTVSGREEHFDLCNSCYNAVHFEAYKVLKTIREITKSKGGKEETP